jgi:hypothetical protein
MSPIEHLARICCGTFGDWRDVLMGMVAVFDASGTETDTSIMVVAGFVSSAREWKKFSLKWVRRLKRDGLEYMHMKEFAHSTDQFSSGWKGDEKRRQGLLSDLMTLIKQHAEYKFGVIVTNETFKNILSPETKQEWDLNAYSLTGRCCALQVNEWATKRGFKFPIKLIFEMGDPGAGKLLHRLIEDGYQAPAFEPKKDKITSQGIFIPAFVPLQAADFLAYEIYLEVDRMYKGDNMHSKRWALTQFDKMPGDIGTWKEEDLKRFQSMTVALINKPIITDIPK